MRMQVQRLVLLFLIVWFRPVLRQKNVQDIIEALILPAKRKASGEISENKHFLETKKHIAVVEVFQKSPVQMFLIF